MMKKKLLNILMPAFYILIMVYCVKNHGLIFEQAKENLALSTVEAEEMHPLRVVDEADILYDSEEEDLLSLVNEISERQQFDVVCVTVDSLDGEDIQYFAADYYDYNGYGMGKKYDGAMFIVSMQERQWYMLTTGYAMDILTDADLADMEDEIIPYLSDGDYAQAFTAFANECDAQISYGVNDEGAYESDGSTEDVYTKEEFMENESTEDVYAEDDYGEESAPGIILSVIIGLVLAFVPTLVMRGQLKSVHMQNSAGQYEKHDSRKITVRRDIFLYHTVNRVPKPKDNPNRSGGGGSSFRGSSGRSHGGRGGGF